MLRQVVKYESKLLFADGMAVLTIILFLGAMAYAGWIGLRYTNAQETEQKVYLKNHEERITQTRQEILALEREMVQDSISLDTYAWGPRSPYYIGSYQGTVMAYPGNPLAAFSIGQNDLQPTAMKVTVAGITPARIATLENPFKLLVGHFDLAFVFLYIYPLLIIALTFGLTSVERESGLLRMLLAQPLKLSTLAAGKIGVRALILGGSVVVGTGLLTLFIRADGTFTSWLLWVLVALLYGAFWLGLAVFVDSRVRSASTSALALAGAWLVLAVVLPALISFFSAALYPVPSRMEYITAMRTETTVAQQQGAASLARFFEDHPEIAPVSDEDANFAILRVAQQEQIAEQLAPLDARYNEQRARRQAFINKIGYLSPTILTHQAFMEIAGTGSTHHSQFREDVESFHEVWKAHMIPLYVADVAFRSADFDSLPTYSAAAKDRVSFLSRIGPPMSFVLLAGLLLFGFGFSRYRRQELI